MMAMRRWDPFQDLEAMQRQMGRFFDEPFRMLPWRGLAQREFEGELGALDVYETEGSIVIEATLPGVKPEDLKLSVTDHTLHIEGETKLEQEIKREQYHRQERRFGTFGRSVTLPPYAEIDKADATYEHGLLKITMPKAEQAKAKTIPVRTTLEGQQSRPALEGTKQAS
jgi:HSP20 family protein